eukprot:1616286-Pyramimonas_sp.AAC.1
MRVDEKPTGPRGRAKGAEKGSEASGGHRAATDDGRRERRRGAGSIYSCVRRPRPGAKLVPGARGRTAVARWQRRGAR